MGTDLYPVHVERRDVIEKKSQKQWARNLRSLRSEWFRFLRKLREVTERESGKGVTAMEVSR